MKIGVYTIDLDFGDIARDKVVEYVTNKHGKDKVCSLGAFQYVWAKGAIKDIGKVLGIPYTETDKITKSFDGSLDFKEVMESGVIDQHKKTYPELFDYCEKLSGLPKSFGVHPCFTKGHLVATKDGYKKIEDINVGDLVLTHKNNYKPIVNVGKKKNNDIYKIRTMSNYNINVTGNHPILCKKRVQGIKEKRYLKTDWIKVEDINKLDVIGYPINTKSKDIKYGGLPTESLDFWWIVGCYLGDGWLKTRENSSKMTEISCNKKEYKTVLSKANSIFEFVHYSNKSTTTNVIICNDELHSFLSKFGKYAENKFIPQFVVDLPVDKLEAFLDGYMFADGSHSKKDDNYSFSTVSKVLANSLRDCVMKVFKTPLSSFEREPQQYKIEKRVVNGKRQWRGSFYKKKKSKATWFIDGDYMWIPVYSVEKTNRDDYVYNLTVLDDSSYVVEGMAVHNCGKVISNSPILELSAVDLTETMPTLMLDMHEAEDLGMVKFDFLGLRTVDAIYNTLKLIGKDYNYIAPHSIDFDDELVWNEFEKGHTDMIFQFSSEGMKKTLKNMKARSILDLTAANALYRPGSMAFIPDYTKRKSGEEDVVYLHPDLEDILKPTYGIIVFQEQLIEIGRLANMTNPDLLRKATGKLLARLV